MLAWPPQPLLTRRPGRGGDPRRRATALPPKPIRFPLWMYGFGVFQATAAAGDSLLLLFAASVLSGSPYAVGVMDAVGTIGTVAGALIISIKLSRVRDIRGLLVLGILATGLSLAPFAILNSLVPAFLLALIVGILTSPVFALAPVVASADLPRSLWGHAFSHLNKATSLGGMAGLALSALWLTGAGHIFSNETTVRLLFVMLSLATVLGGLWSRHSFLVQSASRKLALSSSGPYALINGSGPSPIAARVAPPLLSDPMRYYLLFTFLVFVGLGMSFSGVHAYLVSGLKASIILVIVGMLFFRLLSYFISGPLAQGHASHFPLHVQSAAVLARAALILVIGVEALLLPHSVAAPVAAGIIALWGLSAGAISITGNQVLAQMTVPERWGLAQVAYVLVVNVGGVLGAWLGGALASFGGFTPMFLLAAALTALGSLLLLRI